MGHVVRPVISMGMSPWLHCFCCEISTSIRSHAVHNVLMLDKAFCKSMGGGSGRCFVVGECKSTSRIYACLKLSMLSTCHWVAGSPCWLILLYQGFSIELCCGLIRCSVLAAARPALVRGRPWPRQPFCFGRWKMLPHLSRVLIKHKSEAWPAESLLRALHSGRVQKECAGIGSPNNIVLVRKDIDFCNE